MAREIKIDGEASDWYKEGYFILKENVDSKKIHSNLVEYADHLVGSHMKIKGKAQVAYTQTNKKRDYEKKSMNTEWIDFFFWTSITLFVIISIVYLKG
ncbi:MAG: hypothetical protein ACRCSG_06345 [Cellulosilyticaceae bacterium]